MAQHWFGRPGYRGYDDAARYLASDECRAWLETLSKPNRSWELEALKHERAMNTLESKRNRLAERVGASFPLLHWSMYQDPKRELTDEIKALAAIKESYEAAGPSHAELLHQQKLALRMGYEDFKKSGLTPNAYAMQAKEKYFPKLRGGRLSPRQIDRHLKKFIKQERIASSGARRGR